MSPGEKVHAEALDLLLAGGVQRRLQLDIERPRAGAAPVHRAQHLDVAYRMEAEPAGNALADQGQDAFHRLFGILRGHEVEVAVALSRVELRHLARVDPMRIDDDPALGRLPEHVGQAHDRDRTGADDVREHLAGANRGQLVNVADEQQGGMIGHGLQQRLHQQDIDHRAFVHHE